MPLFRSGRRQLNLKVSVMAHVTLGALACALVVAGLVVAGANHEIAGRLHDKADLIAKTLQLRGMQTDAWDLATGNLLEDGFCAQFVNNENRVVHAVCRGSDAARSTMPGWFAEGYRLIFASGVPVQRIVEAGGKRLGTVETSFELSAAAARAWQEMTRIVSITAGAVALLCLLAYLAIDRALRPTAEITAGLARLANGELSHRLPAFRLIELQRISEIINHMAARLEAAMSECSELSRRLAIAQEEERHHLARELHDEFGQNLAAINAIAASIETTAESQCPALVPEAQSLSHIAMKMMDELRHTLVRLRPAIVDEVGLVASLETLVAGWNARLGHTTHFGIKVRGSFDTLPDAAAINLYRIAQEGLTNAAKHSGARNVTVTLEHVPAAGAALCGGTLALTIEDDGKGGASAEGRSIGAGLAGIRERIAVFGGSMALHSVASEGTSLSVSMPATFAMPEAA